MKRSATMVALLAVAAAGFAQEERRVPVESWIRIDLMAIFNRRVVIISVPGGYNTHAFVYHPCADEEGECDDNRTKPTLDFLVHEHIRTDPSMANILRSIEASIDAYGTLVPLPCERDDDCPRPIDELCRRYPTPVCQALAPLRHSPHADLPPYKEFLDINPKLMMAGHY